MFVNIGIYVYKFWVFLFFASILSLFSIGFTPHKAKQSLATRYGFVRGKEKKRNIEGMS